MKYIVCTIIGMVIIYYVFCIIKTFKRSEYSIIKKKEQNYFEWFLNNLDKFKCNEYLSKNFPDGVIYSYYDKYDNIRYNFHYSRKHNGFFIYNHDLSKIIFSYFDFMCSEDKFNEYKNLYYEKISKIK